MQPDDSTKPVVVREPDASKDARPVLRGGSSREARSLPSNPAFEQARTRFVEGLAHFGAARWAEAEQSFEAALALMPGRPSVLTNLGATRLRLGRPAEALELAKAETLARPASAGLWELRARAESALGRRLAQHRSLAEVYAIQGNYAESANQLALARAAGDGDFFEQSAVDSRLREVRVLLEEQLRESRQQR